jgi:protein-tyrosine phosphatase
MTTATGTARIDVHSHLLPGVDDGCKTIQDSIDCARVLVANGYTHAFCTPHLWHKYTGVTRVTVPRWLTALQAQLDAAAVPLKLLPGGELNLYLGVDKTPDEDIVTMGNAGKYMLVDMWAAEVPDFFEPAIRWLQGKGLKVILAHPERMRAVQDNPQIVDYFHSLGIALQGNLQCFADKPDARTRQCAETFLHDGKYFLLGSDTHNPETIGVRMEGLRRVVELIGERAANELTFVNPSSLLPE